MPVENVTQNTFFTTIQAAINAADAGDTIQVAAGTYNEFVDVSKPLSIRGANYGVDPNTDSRGDESIISFDGDYAVEIFASNVTFDGFSVSNTQGNAVRISVGRNTSGIVNDVSVSNNIATGAAILSCPDCPGLYMGVLSFDNFQDTSYTSSGIAFTNNRLTVSATNGRGITMSAYNGSQLTGAISISGNHILKSGTPKNIAGVELRSSSGTSSMQDVAISGNTISGFDFPGVWLRGQATAIISENNLSGNTKAIHNENLTFVTANANFWGTVQPDFAALVVGDVDTSTWYADAALTILVNADSIIGGEGTIGSDVEGPVIVSGGATVSVSASVNLGSDALVLVSGTLEAPTKLVVTGSLNTTQPITLPANTVLRVEGGALNAGNIQMSEGSRLEVVGGDITFGAVGEQTTLSGTFVFFDSFGSVNIGGDTTVASSGNWILISDVHVADGVTITVTGGLIWDGSYIDSPGRFDVVVANGGSLVATRSTITNGDIKAQAGGALKMNDNELVSTTVVIDAGVSGAEVFHNIAPAGFLTDNGTGTVTEVNGWGNVTNFASTKNRLLLNIDLYSVPAGRTLDSVGNVFIQPGDKVQATIDVSALENKISAVELLLGYNSNLFDVASLGLAEDWDVLINTPATTLGGDAAPVIAGDLGKLDAAIGLSFDFADSSGTDADQVIGDVELASKASLGDTVSQFFHRVKFESDTFGGETRLTTGGPAPSYLTPFTANTGFITIDGTKPSIADVNLHASVTQFGVDMTDINASTIQGNLEVTAAAFDALAGIENAKAVVTLVGPTTYTVTQTGVTTGPEIAGDDYTTYSYTYAVDEKTENGTYNVVFTVTDRSGNQTVETLGSILINKNQVLVNVELEGLAAGSLTRDVVLVFTNSLGAVIETRTEAIEFTGGVGSVTLTDVDGDSFRLSAKTAWNLRKRLEVGFDPDGQSTVSFNGTNKLPGGDLNGDNVVNTLDYSILRFNWFTSNAVADITGDGPVNATDYAILQANFYVAGDPQ